MLKQNSLKPQDVVILIKLLIHRSDSTFLKQLTIAFDLCLSQSQVGTSLKRLKFSKLIDSYQKPSEASSIEFLTRGFKYMFPPSIGSTTRGLPTAHAAPPLSKKIKYSIDDIYVWPDANGGIRGQAIAPLYPSMVEACARDVQLYEYIALLDGIRVGRAREVKMATDEIRKRISNN